LQPGIELRTSRRRSDMKKREVVLVVLATVLALSSVGWAESPAALNDPTIAHVAYTADLIDIRYAHLALGVSKNPAVRAFAETMIRDHTAVNDRAVALLQKLKVQPQDNAVSHQLLDQSETLVDELRQLSGAAFDQRYARNELSYHRAVNELVEKTFIPKIENRQMKALFQDALVIFRAHEQHAQHMVDTVALER
jgi:putative membrane protein